MLNFFKTRFGKIEAVQETQRDVATRALKELNAVMAGLEVKPKLSFDPASGEISIELPEQMPDEALALPAPDKVQDSGKADDAAEEKLAEAA